jgi:Na+-transporting methylmalonyl-CoA/oxaloacetate decarboxylase gamma subunit
MDPLFILQSVVTESIQIAIIGYVIVFTALLLLYIIFTYLAKGIIWQNKRKLQSTNKLKELKDEDLVISGEVAAAISMAIYLCRDLHDNESDVITIKKVSKAYSPWSSKIYGMRFFNR